MLSRATHAGRAWLRQVDPGWVALFILFLFSLLLLTPRLYAVDSVEYFSYLPSLLFDGDLDFTDEYSYFMQQNPQAGIEGVLYKRDPHTGLPLNVAPVGTALLWSPAYLLAHGVVLISKALGAPLQADGLSRPYILSVCYASVFYAGAGLWLSYRLCRQYFSALASALAVALVFMATPVIFYSHVNPPWSHSVSLFCVALFVTVWHNSRGDRRQAQYLLLGLLGGLMYLVREQDGLFLLIPALEALLDYGRIIVERGRELWPAFRRRFGRHLLLLLGLLLGIWPQFLAYRVLNGRFGPNVTVGYKFDWSSPHFFRVLFSPQYGLLVWSPLLLLALLGLALLWRRDRLLSGALTLAFLAQVYIAGTFLTWQSPGSFGQRRFINCAVIFCLGLAALLAWLRKKGWPAGLLIGLGGLFALWNGALILHWGLYEADREAGLLWDRLPRRVLVEIPRQGFDLLRRLLWERETFYDNPGG
ncbi:MAG: glycosyltransferase family 39 protein [Chloroflexia bacterium]|nr:glycosyltransferase family 39 protein [Chloroflexia bacterium]